MGLLAPPPASAQQANVPYGAVVLQELDKVTARVKEVTVPVNKESLFGSLTVTPKACLKTPPTEAPESAAFLEISDVEAGKAAVKVFSGWMYASSPAISAMEHPVYDVWVIDCAEPLQPTLPEPGRDAPQAPQPGPAPQG